MQKYFVFAGIYSDYFCMYFYSVFFALIANVQNVARQQRQQWESLYFDEDMPEDQILAAAMSSRAGRGAEAQYISAAQAWENFKTDYFEDGGAGRGFADDNPLSGSASYRYFSIILREQIKSWSV